LLRLEFDLISRDAMQFVQVENYGHRGPLPKATLMVFFIEDKTHMCCAAI